MIILEAGARTLPLIVRQDTERGNLRNTRIVAKRPLARELQWHRPVQQPRLRAANHRIQRIQLRHPRRRHHQPLLRVERIILSIDTHRIRLLRQIINGKPQVTPLLLRTNIQHLGFTQLIHPARSILLAVLQQQLPALLGDAISVNTLNNARRRHHNQRRLRRRLRQVIPVRGDLRIILAAHRIRAHHRHLRRIQVKRQHPLRTIHTLRSAAATLHIQAIPRTYQIR